MLEKKREDIFWLMNEILNNEEMKLLRIEILYSALLFLKGSPEESIYNALIFGINEWVK